jgi:hypothetical protein
VPPQPVLPLLNMQFVGISVNHLSPVSLSSCPKKFAHSGAEIVLKSFIMIIFNGLSIYIF